MFSFIIITFNEEKKIESVIDSIKNAANGFDYEIIVSDGGSQDKTLKKLQSFEVKVINSDPGRGIQFRAGEKAASGNIYIFLHGDTIFPENGLQIISEFFNKGEIKAATLRMGFDGDSLIYKIYSQFTKFDSIFTSFGDQCIVVERDLYIKTGGFPAWQIFEDVELLRKIRKYSKIYSLPAEVITSARRFKKYGLIKQQFINFFMIIGFLVGVRHDKLARIYNKRKKGGKSALILFLRYPEAGRVKTRLAKSIGKLKASEFYKKCCENCFGIVLKLNDVHTFIFSANSDKTALIKKWINNNRFKIKAQSNGDLGKRMYNAAKELKDLNYDKIVILGTDIPDISDVILSQAFKKLDKADFVIGPGYDGGYYLIGFRQINYEIFQEINWSSEEVLEQTVKKINNMGCSYTLLPKLLDIDYKEDLIKWFSEVKDNKHPISEWIKKEKIL